MIIIKIYWEKLHWYIALWSFPLDFKYHLDNLNYIWILFYTILTVVNDFFEILHVQQKLSSTFFSVSTRQYPRNFYEKWKEFLLNGLENCEIWSILNHLITVHMEVSTLCYCNNHRISSFFYIGGTYIVHLKQNIVVIIRIRNSSFNFSYISLRYILSYTIYLISNQSCYNHTWINLIKCYY